MTFAEEQQMTEPVVRYWRRKGYAVSEEVHVMGRLHDVVAWEPSTRELVVVELKLSNWKRALHQALYPRQWANRTFIGLPEKAIESIDKNRLLIESTGIGVLSVSQQRVRVLLPAVKQPTRRTVSRAAAIKSAKARKT